ncbi:MAG: ExeM/NucH family extracellular endonuclease, partial [Glaciihabitans sp.]|nr:ExeM/NucH family extracellular endonuclease [Glaciihabitans sp.]
KPVIFDYRNDAWKFQPTSQLTGGENSNAATVSPATFSDTRTAAPEEVGGDVKLGTFNVLNYFTTTGDSLTGCSYYTDRQGNSVTVNSGCDARGAANADDLELQQAKIVAAINGLDADVVSLEEIENSARFNKPRDAALSDLVDALNEASPNTWAFVPSPAALPTSEDVIRTAFIYKPAAAELVGTSTILNDEVNFDNAREPLAQAFKPAGATDEEKFTVIVNHFKSKSASGATGANVDSGQGAFTADRVGQANALVAFADTFQNATDDEKIFLVGDFNSYAKEDPIAVLESAGYLSQEAKTGEYTYAFDGTVGSLDHVFASPSADAAVVGADVWNINSYESIAYEYSRNNYNLTNFYSPDAYRSSDHDPVVVGIETTIAPAEPKTLNILGINDFHGRIDGKTTAPLTSTTVNFAGTIEKLRAEGGTDNDLLISAGDNIGASLYNSSSQLDQPTIDVLNALGLEASAVGNHEFDKGFDDLTGRVIGAEGSENAQWDYLGANVYEAGTKTPVLDEYSTFEVNGVTVGVIGVITQETPTLVAEAGIRGLEFGEPVEAVNRVATQLSDGDLTNGEADIIIAEYHEGAGSGVVEGATVEEEIAAGGAFAKIASETSAAVDAVFTGHTHKQYAWDAPIPGEASKTRPIVQTGSYGEYVGQIVLTLDADNNVSAYTAKNVPRSTATTASLVEAYPVAAEVQTIVDAAVDAAAVTGRVPVGKINSDITTAYALSSGKLVRDDRTSESTLGNLVADALVAQLANPALGGAEIGVVNPGGLRSDLLYAASSTPGDADGVVTTAEAVAVLPFANNLWTETLTGAQFKKVLEQQWQRTAAGTVPSRAFLNLGLSENVSYTYDATLPEGSRITSITVDGAPIDPAKSYRVGTFGFLLDGGDNFHEFRNGTDRKDSGLVDLDAWVDFLGDNTADGLDPEFDRRGVAVSAVPTETLEPGDSGSVVLSKLDLTSLGSPTNTEVSASFEGSTAEAVVSPVTAGSATAAFTVPADVEDNATLVLVAKESGTTVRVALAINGAEVDPTDPTDPTIPTDPTDPTDPTAPTEPTDPTIPVDPTDPTIPVDPTDPTDPTTPVDPTIPTDPTIPVEPTDPTTPVEPTDPTIPVDPTTPVEPTDPTDPTEPATPVTPPIASPAPAGSISLTVEREDLIDLDVSVVLPGDSITITVGSQYIGQYVAAFLYSTPVSLGGWMLVDGNGQIEVTIPSDAPAGEHRIAVQDAAGNVIGWTALTIASSTIGAGSGSTPVPVTGTEAGNLASTGTDSASALMVASLLLFLGAAIIVIRRRRLGRGEGSN